MKKARKILVFLMVLTFTLSVSLSAFAASDKSGKGQTKGKAKHSTESTLVSEPTATEPMPTETPALPTWTVKKANNKLVQFQSTDKKGGKIVIPLQAMKSHGIEAIWDEATQTVTFSNSTGMQIIMGVNGITTPLDLTAAASASTPTQTATAAFSITSMGDISPDEAGAFTAQVSGASGDVADAMTGTITGTVNNDPAIIDPGAQTISGTFAGTVVDPLMGILNISGTVAGTVANPEIILNQQTQSLSSLAGGHAYVPFKWLSEYFGTTAAEETAADTSAVTDENATDDSNDTLAASDDSEADEGTDTDDESADTGEESDTDEIPAE
ncbi:MAG: hypothetical protein ABRQ23_02640 [Syntrophomonadaceae bacterium]